MKVTLYLNPAGGVGKPLASATVEIETGELAGLQLQGFAVWQNQHGERSVSFPQRTYYTSQQKKRSFAVVKGSEDLTSRIADAILAAYATQTKGQTS